MCLAVPELRNLRPLPRSASSQDLTSTPTVPTVLATPVAAEAAALAADRGSTAEPFLVVEGPAAVLPIIPRLEPLVKTAVVKMINPEAQNIADRALTTLRKSAEGVESKQVTSEEALKLAQATQPPRPSLRTWPRSLPTWLQTPRWVVRWSLCGEKSKAEA